MGVPEAPRPAYSGRGRLAVVRVCRACGPADAGLVQHHGLGQSHGL